MLGNMSIGMIESLLPIWISDHFKLSALQMSAVFLPSTIAYFVSVPLWGCIHLFFFFLIHSILSLFDLLRFWNKSWATQVNLSWCFVNGSRGFPSSTSKQVSHNNC